MTHPGARAVKWADPRRTRFGWMITQAAGIRDAGPRVVLFSRTTCKSQGVVRCTWSFEVTGLLFPAQSGSFRIRLIRSFSKHNLFSLPILNHIQPSATISLAVRDQLKPAPTTIKAYASPLCLVSRHGRPNRISRSSATRADSDKSGPSPSSRTPDGSIGQRSL